MQSHKIVSQAEWLAARKALLAKEKAFTRERDELSRQRRELPWVKIEKRYVFTGRDGPVTLAELFAGKSQLIVNHFMFDPSWNAGCKSCSFWADQYDGIIPHLAQRDTALVAISRAPIEKLLAFQQRMGWDFPWVSSGDGDFNYDFAISFKPETLAAGEAIYNYASTDTSMRDLPGMSVFARAGDDIFHTYSCYARGLDMLNAAYHFLDLSPKGRDEEDLPYSMHWVKLHDEYSS